MKNRCDDCSSGFPERPESAHCKCGDSSNLSHSVIGTEKPSEGQEEDRVIQGILLNLSEEISCSSHSPMVWAQIIERVIELLKEGETDDREIDTFSIDEIQTALAENLATYQNSHVMGRPSKFTVDIASRILSRIIEGEPLYKICAPEEMPSKGTVISWLYQFEAFGQAYRQARKQQAHLLADSALEAAEEASDTDKLKIQKARLVHQARLIMAEKYNPGEFGRKVELQGVTGHLSHEHTVRILQERREAAAININPFAQIEADSVKTTK